MARERTYLDDAHEVRYAERAFHPRHPATLDEVRAAVDALEPRRSAIPTPAPPPPPPEPLPPAIAEDLEVALAPAVPGRLVDARRLDRIGAGQIAEATYETADGRTRKTLYVIENGAARPFEDVEARIDALPMPAPRAAASEPVAAPMPPPAEETPAVVTSEPTPAAEETKKGGIAGRLKFGRKTPEATEESPKQSGGGIASRFRRGKKTTEEKTTEQTPAAPARADAEDAPQASKLGGLASRLRLPRKTEEKSEEKAAGTPSPEPAEAASGPEEKPSKRRFPFGRK